ncbi:UNVERIFIED_ASMBLY: capsid triplex subunit 1 [human gammaherpesvirus 4]|uniref:BORF1 n=1 Tax=Epstein-Barr virus (strain GD1) TaxID=10376 RepID=Q3KSU6_EBVG|nr:unknown [human gammaherpesvirus 4]AIM62198.1 capsid triplex subunit 1 [human gammaherpesvirus 4]AKA28380.1 putative capsid protein VP19C [human gammaherpesvirus 4]AKA28519.1 putative capsid protein VP19C [human gammaherpesvirus 4]ALQ28689.1 putative capsid protein VP19C [human gammaherpesvirus 4]
MKVQGSVDRRRLQRRIAGLLPPPARRLNISRGSEFARDVRGLVEEHAQASSLSAAAVWRAGLLAPGEVAVAGGGSGGGSFSWSGWRPPVFGDFLIHASSFNNAEATGTPLFQFKQSDPFSGVDAVFTPLSLFILMNHGRGVAARVEAGGGLTRMANLLYDSPATLADLVPDFGRLVADRRFHNFITPVGPLVENIKSTYLNKITTVVHGPVVSKAIPRSTVKVTVPQEAFVDLDAWLSGGAGGGGGGCFVGGLGLQPCPADARLYVALTYEEAGPRFTFFQSSRGHCQIMNILRIYYSPSIMHRYAVVQPLHIEELTFGAVACLGTFSATDGWRRSAFNYRGSSLPVVEIDSFYSNVSDWEVIL